MKLFYIGQCFLAAALAAVVVGAGCQRDSQPGSRSGTRGQAGQGGPEESFAAIVDMFRRGVEDIPIGFVVQDETGGHSMLTGRNEVTHQLIPPQKEGEPYKGVITVETESRYSMQRSEESDENNQNGQQGESTAGQAENEFGVEILDPDLVSAPKARRQGTPKGEKNGVMVARQENETRRSYELVYENGRWRLVTPLDPKTEKSIQFAFEQALDSQG